MILTMVFTKKSSKKYIQDKIKAICLYHNTDIEQISLSNTIEIDKLDLNLFPKKCLKVIGTGNIERECDFEYEDMTISIFAWSEGKAGKENKHELPDPIDTNLYFGNIFAIASKDNKVVNLSLDDWNKFYEKAFNGFESLGSEDTWSTDEDDDSSLSGFIVNDDEIEYMDKTDEEEDSDYVETHDEETSEYIDADDDKDDDEDEEYLEETTDEDSDSTIVMDGEDNN